MLCRHRFFVALLRGGGRPRKKMRLRTSFLLLQDMMPLCNVKLKNMAQFYPFKATLKAIFLKF
jgi:hypothetical protein